MTLQLSQLTITLNGTALFEPVSLVIKPGDVATVMGPSGIGKSTLLAAISGALSHEFSVQGDVILNGQSMISIPMERRRIGVLLQDDLLFPHLNIRQNLAFAVPPEYRRRDRKKIVDDALDKAGLKGFAHRDPATLSGGQRARVSLLRSLLAEPNAILLDEPFSKLDQKLKSHIREFVFGQIKQLGIPALLVTHDPNDCPGGILLDLETNRVEQC